MSLLSKLKNKLQDPTLNETKLREYDECMLLLKNENIELHRRIDQLEAMCKTKVSYPRTHHFDEHIRVLEQENGRLLAENQCQRQEYERFLDQLTTMVIQTAVMQENIRSECASIYHLIEQLANLKHNQNEMNGISTISIDDKKNNENTYFQINICNDKRLSSSSASSVTTHCSSSTSNSWPLDSSIENQENTKNQLSVPNISTEEKQENLQRSETFTVSKVSSSVPMTLNNHSKLPRPSRLPSRRTECKTQSSTTITTNRSSSIQKASKVPIRTTTSLNRQENSTKKSHIPMAIIRKTNKDSTVTSNRSIPSVNNSTIKKTTRSSPTPTSVIQSTLNKIQSHTITIIEKNNISSALNKYPKITRERIKSNDTIEKIKSTSSESSIEEEQQLQHMNKLLHIAQDDGYSTWSSIDVKDDVIKNNIENNLTHHRQNTNGFVNTWLHTSNRQNLKQQPVNEVDTDKLEEFPIKSSIIRTCCTNIHSTPATLITTSFSNKDISIDSLENSQSNEQTITSSSSSSSSSLSTYSHSETFENLLITQTLSNLDTNLSDSTSSTSSTFNMSEYIEDHFIDPDDNYSENSLSFSSINKNSYLLSKPQKRLLIPGLLNRLIFLRRTLSDSDLRTINEYDNQYNVYHSNIINEHSIEVNLINTYGSDSELHVWSHDCSEQRRFVDDRQDNFTDSNQQLALERQILLQQIYEYPWLLQENDLDRTTNIEQQQATSDIILPSHNPNFYQLCALTNSSSFVISYDPNRRQTNTSPTTSTFL